MGLRQYILVHGHEVSSVCQSRSNDDQVWIRLSDNPNILDILCTVDNQASRTYHGSVSYISYFVVCSGLDMHHYMDELSWHYVCVFMQTQTLLFSIIAAACMEQGISGMSTLKARCIDPENCS